MWQRRFFPKINWAVDFDILIFLSLYLIYGSGFSRSAYIRMFHGGWLYLFTAFSQELFSQIVNRTSTHFLNEIFPLILHVDSDKLPGTLLLLAGTTTAFAVTSVILFFAWLDNSISFKFPAWSCSTTSFDWKVFITWFYQMILCHCTN